MPLLRTLARRAAPVLRGHTVAQRAHVSGKPAKDSVGPMEVVMSREEVMEIREDLVGSDSVQRAKETVVGIGMFSMAILAPSGWILAHLEDYKKKD